MPARAVDVSNVYSIHKLERENSQLKQSFRKSGVSQLMQEIETLEKEDKNLESIVDSLHKEVDQARVIRAAKRFQHVADLEYNEAIEKVRRAKLCIQTIIEEEGDFLSDPDAFVVSYCDRLDKIVDKLEEDLGATASFMEINASPFEDDDDSPLSTLNEATRQKLLVQVEIERVNEEIRAELEYSAMVEPVSHPIVDFDSDSEVEAELLEDLSSSLKQRNPGTQASFLPPCLPEVLATNKQTNTRIQNAVSHLTSKVSK